MRCKLPLIFLSLTLLFVSSGHAQRNIAHRLAYTFGPRARVTGRWHEGYYLAELRVPLPAGGRS